MKRLLLPLIILAAAYVWQYASDDRPNVDRQPGRDESALRQDAIAGEFDDRHSGSQVTGDGVVTRILADDHDGSRHQRFILRLDSGQTLLIAHNIDLAPRIESLHEGDAVSFHGVYEWNDRGGLIHWTHHDPQGQQTPGWLRHNDRIYE